MWCLFEGDSYSKTVSLNPPHMHTLVFTEAATTSSIVAFLLIVHLETQCLCMRKIDAEDHFAGLQLQTCIAITFQYTI